MNKKNKDIQADIYRRIDIANGHQPLPIDLYQNRGFGSSPKRDNTTQIHAADKSSNLNQNQSQSSPSTAHLLRFWRRKLNLYWILEDLKGKDNK